MKLIDKIYNWFFEVKVIKPKREVPLVSCKDIFIKSYERQSETVK